MKDDDSVQQTTQHKQLFNSEDTSTNEKDFPTRVCGSFSSLKFPEHYFGSHTLSEVMKDDLKVLSIEATNVTVFFIPVRDIKTVKEKSHVEKMLYCHTVEQHQSLMGKFRHCLGWCSPCAARLWSASVPMS